MRLVVHASAIVDRLLAAGQSPVRDTLRSPDAELHVPSLCDVELASTLRWRLRARQLNGSRAQQALDDYLAMPLRRHGHQGLLARILELRDQLSAHDATYVALAEQLDASLVTTDLALARAVRARGYVPVLP